MLIKMYTSDKQSGTNTVEWTAIYPVNLLTSSKDTKLLAALWMITQLDMCDLSWLIIALDMMKHLVWYYLNLTTGTAHYSCQK